MPNSGYLAAKAAVERLAREKGYALRYIGDTGRFELVDAETGQRQTNNLILGVPDSFTLEQAKQWLSGR